MKNIEKFTAILFVLVLIITIFSGCEKDDENSSSPGYFIVDGKRYNLDNAYYDFHPEEEHYKGVKYIQHGVYFLSKDIPTKEEDILASTVPIKGAIASFQCMDPLKAKIPGQGEYSFQGDYLAPKAFTYFDFFVGYSSDWRAMQDTSKTKSFYIYELVEVKTDGEIYEFKSKGTTPNKKSFEFYFKGTIVPMPEDSKENN